MGFNGRVFLLVIIQLIMGSTEKTPITILKMIKVIQDGRKNVAWSFNTTTSSVKIPFQCGRVLSKISLTLILSPK
jgi:hypothetical protein